MRLVSVLIFMGIYLFVGVSLIKFVMNYEDVVTGIEEKV